MTKFKAVLAGSALAVATLSATPAWAGNCAFFVMSGLGNASYFGSFLADPFAFLEAWVFDRDTCSVPS